MKFASILAISIALVGNVNALSLPRFAATRARALSKIGKSPSAVARFPPPADRKYSRPRHGMLFKTRGGWQLGETSSADAEPDAEEAAEKILSMLVIDAVATTKELALNWGFVLNSGIVKIIGGLLALSLPILATDVAYSTITIALAFIAAFNIAGLFNAQNGFKVQSFLVGATQAFLAYRMRFRPFEGLNVLTALLASASVVDGMFESVVALQNSDLPGRWALFFSGLASIAGGAFVAINLPEASLFVLGILLGSNLISSGWSGIFAALKGRDIANTYLNNANFEKDAFEAIEAATS